MNKFAEHIKGHISKSAATVKELEELAKKYEEDLRGLGYTDMQVDPYFAYGQYGFYFNFMRDDGRPGQKFTGLDTKNNTKLNLRNAYYDLINRKNWYLKRQAKQASKCAKVIKKANIYDKIDDYLETINYFDRGLYSKGGIWVSFKDNTALNSFKKHLDELNIKYKEYTLGNDFYDDENGDRQVIYIKSEQWRDRESSKTKKMTKKAFTYEDEKAALAKFLNVKEEEIKETEHPTNSYSKINAYEINKEDGNEIYTVSSDTKQIIQEVADSIKDVYDSYGYEDFQDLVLETLGNLKKYKKYGKLDFIQMAKDQSKKQGYGIELAKYDNETNEINYNGKTYYIFRQAKKDKKMNKLANIIGREIRKSAIAENDYFDIIEVDENNETIDLIESDYTNGIATVIEKAKEIANNEGKHIIVVNRFTEEDEDGNEYVNDDLNETVWDSEKDVEIEKYGIEFRNMNKGYYNIIITDTEEKAKEILKYMEELEDETDEKEIIFIWEDIDFLAIDTIEEIDTDKIERLKGIYKGIKIINYNKNIPQLWLY